MKFLAITMHTPLAPQQVASEISENSKPASLLDSFVLRDMDKFKFIGSASGSFFKLVRNTGNPFPAVLIGNVQESVSGSDIRIRVRPPWASSVMLLLLLAFLYLVTRSDYSGPSFWVFAVASISLFLLPFLLGTRSSVDQLKAVVKAST